MTNADRPASFLCKLVAIAAALSVPTLLDVSHARAEVGVAAAVNTDARGKAPGEQQRVITLGESVLFNEEIATDARGLVQLLLLDGTTFTVGPNSHMKIDEFVYDPSAGDAHVVATFTKGTFRFIGGQSSRKPGGATLNTPMGTIGVRGAMVECTVDSQNALFSMIFGDEVRFTGAGGKSARIFKPGYTLVVSGKAGKLATNVRPRTRDDATTFQAVLAGKRDQNGGTPQHIDNETVDGSGVVAVNSDRLPLTGPIPLLLESVITATNIDQVEQNVAQFDIVTQQQAQSQTTRSVSGFITGLGESSAESGPYLLSSDGQPNFSLTVNGDFNSVAGNGQLYDIEDGSNVVASYDVTFGPTLNAGGATLRTDGGQNIAGNISSIYIVSGRASPIAGPQHCTSCDFIDWGWWGASVQIAAHGTEVPQGRTDSVTMGTWVAGDITNPADLPSNITASYSGTALGTVAKQMSGGVSTYVAHGDMNMSFDFNNRTGNLQISHFDGSNLSGSIIDSSTANQALFIGGISGSGAVGVVQGAFVNNGTNVAAGVIGDFQFGRTGYLAGGTIAGKRN